MQQENRWHPLTSPARHRSLKTLVVWNSAPLRSLTKRNCKLEDCQHWHTLVARDGVWRPSCSSSIASGRRPSRTYGDVMVCFVTILSHLHGSWWCSVMWFCTWLWSLVGVEYLRLKYSSGKNLGLRSWLVLIYIPSISRMKFFECLSFGESCLVFSCRLFFSNFPSVAFLFPIFLRECH